jgi:carbonic anhydrase
MVVVDGRIGHTSLKLLVRSLQIRNQVVKVCRHGKGKRKGVNREDRKMSVIAELVAANERYAAGFAQGERPARPARRLAVVTCMDARLDPARFLGLAEGDAHVIRNAGGIVNDETIRSLVVSHHLLGTEETLVIGHTGCGMVDFTNDDIHARLGPASESIDFEPFPDVAERVRQSVEAIRSHPLLGGGLGATGFVYDVESGRIEPV